MITRYSAWLDGEGLQDIDKTIIILDIQEQLPQSRIQTAGWAAGRDGTRFIRETTLTRSVTIRLQVREYDVTRRKTITSDVAAWAAKGGYLTINDRPGQRLKVRCSSMPVVASALKWTDTLVITLTAYEWPYWEDESTHSATLSGDTYAALDLYVPGNGRYAWLSGNLSFAGTATVRVAVGEQYIEMNNVTGGMAWGYEDGILYIRDGSGASVLAHRTPGSSDDLKVFPGKANSIEITSTVPLTGSVFSRGCYL